jgi:hypothetical protein
MAHNEPETWRYALLGGIASIPLSVGLYRLTGAGSTFSLNMVFFGGVLAGYSAEIGNPQLETTAVGIRTGLIGGLPAFVQLLETTSVPTGPVWFRAAGYSFFVGALVVFRFPIAVLAGSFGAVSGSWLADKTRV